MTLRIAIRRAAKSEFEDAAARYDEQRSGLGEEFAIEIEQTIARAAAAPERYPIVYCESCTEQFRIHKYKRRLTAITSGAFG